MTPVEQLLSDLETMLADRELPYALIGGWAVRAYGVPRPTYDVDITISIERDQLPGFYSAIEELGYDVDDIYRGGQDGRSGWDAAGESKKLCRWADLGCRSIPC